MRRSLPSRTYFYLGACVLLAVSMLAAPATPAPARPAARISAHLTKTSFTSSQASSVKLVYKLSKPSKGFAYELTSKKGKKWQTIRSVKKSGNFKGSRSMTVRKIFGRKSIRVGSYRLNIRFDYGSKRLGFKVKAKPKVTGSGGSTSGGGGTTSGGTAPTTPAGAAPENSLLPTISGQARQGMILTASNGSWTNSPTSFGYQWRSCDTAGASCSDLTGAVSDSYQLQASDVGTTLRVVVTAANQWGSSSASSAQTDLVVSALAPLNTALPTISGVARQGRTLTASVGTWNESPTSFSYQWQRCELAGCGDIVGATGSDYILAAADTQVTVRVVVTAHNPYGSSSANSAESSTVETIPAISVHSNHSCALLANGTVECFGANWNGQLGDGTTIHRSIPSPVSGIANAVGVEAGDAHSCALLKDGTVKCWGFNDSGQLGDGSTNGSGTPITVSGLSNAVEIAVGNSHTCALLSGGAVACWGSDSNGQLGNGAGGASLTPGPVGGLSNVLEISAGDFHTCAVTSGGAVWCWGAGGFGRLGNNSTSDSQIPVQVTGVGGVGNLSGATDVSAGGAHSCARLDTGAVACWGFNERGELGNGDPTYSSSTSPVTVTGIGDATGVTAGEAHSCAVRVGGAVECWGFNHYGQLGSTIQPVTNTPILVSGVANAVQISAGGSHTCAVLADDAASCWGYDAFGQLGNGRALDSPTAVTVSNISSAPLEVGGGNFHTCTLLAGGTVQCWGWNGRGELGDGSFTDSSVPVTVALPGVASDLGVGGSVGGGHACAVVSGEAWCWGYNSHGQLGDGTTSNSATPVQVPGITTATQVSSGGEHSCALLTGGTVKCWGYNARGQLGDNSTSDGTAPVTVVLADGTTPLSGVTSISLGGSHSCALLSDATVHCWGDNGFGKLGNGSTTDSLTPVSVSGLTGVAEINAGFQHSCARTSTGAVSCWGYNGYGELGVITPTDPFSTVPVAAPASSATDVLVGDYHTCAVVAAGAVQCWGDNSHGQLGDGTFDGGPTAVTVTDVTASSAPGALGAGRAHSCAVTSTGLSSWGWNGDGQLGNGAVTHTSTPVSVVGVP